MNIVQPYAKIISIYKGNYPTALEFIESCARVSHRSEELQKENTAEKFIRAVVLGHGDWSVVEHAAASVEFLVDRGITHEIVRHRLASYTQESTRFVNYAKKMPPSFIYPKPDETDIDLQWELAIQDSETHYMALIAKGWRPQEARSVFPNALASKLVMTCNLRNWRQFLLMRTTKEAHPQMRQVTIPLLLEFQKEIPVLFEDIIPESRQVENIAKGR